jgi:hypothetical protein
MAENTVKIPAFYPASLRATIVICRLLKYEGMEPRILKNGHVVLVTAYSCRGKGAGLSVRVSVDFPAAFAVLPGVLSGWSVESQAEDIHFPTVSHGVALIFA